MAVHVVSSMMTPVGIEISRSQPTSANSSPTNSGSTERSMKFWERNKMGARSEKRSNSDVYADQSNICGALSGKSESLRPSRSSSDLNNSITLPDVEVKRKHSADEINGITIFSLRKFKREKKRAKSTTQAPDLDCPLLLINGKRPSDVSAFPLLNDYTVSRLDGQVAAPNLKDVAMSGLRTVDNACILSGAQDYK